MVEQPGSPGVTLTGLHLPLAVVLPQYNRLVGKRLPGSEGVRGAIRHVSGGQHGRPALPGRVGQHQEGGGRRQVILAGVGLHGTRSSAVAAAADDGSSVRHVGQTVAQVFEGSVERPGGDIPHPRQRLTDGRRKRRRGRGARGGVAAGVGGDGQRGDGGWRGGVRRGMAEEGGGRRRSLGDHLPAVAHHPHHPGGATASVRRRGNVRRRAAPTTAGATTSVHQPRRGRGGRRLWYRVGVVRVGLDV